MRTSSVLVTSASVLPLALLLVASCGSERPLVVPPPSGGPSVFSEIDLRIESSEAEFLEANKPTGLAFSVNVYVNQGTRAGRVPELEVFINGTAVTDFMGAHPDAPYQFQHSARPALRNQRALVEFRYKGATYSVQTDTVLGEITTPVTDQTVSASAPVIVRWSGEVPKTVGLNPAWGLAELAGARTDAAGGGETAFVLKPHKPEWPNLPWTGDLTIEWSPERSLPSPFRSLTMQAGLRRLSRFQIQ